MSFSFALPFLHLANDMHPYSVQRGAKLGHYQEFPGVATPPTVAQICNLLYRRFSTCMEDTVTMRARLSRLRLCGADVECRATARNSAL